MMTVEEVEQGPEPTLELIDGQLVCGTVEGSQRVLWMLLESHAPESTVLPLAERELWLRALRAAFAPEPSPSSPSEWRAWAEQLAYAPPIPNAGGRPPWAHWRLHQALSLGLWTEARRLGQVLGRDFVMRLGNNGFTPDLLLVRRDHLARLRHMHLDGPADLVIEIVWPASADQDRTVKRAAYAAGGVPEYWILDPYARTVELLELDAERHYAETRPDAAGFHRSRAVPGLVLNARALEDALRAPRREMPQSLFRSAPDLAPPPDAPESEAPEPGPPRSLIPFRPRLDLGPVAISFEEYIAWCPEAKFELIDGKLEIAGPGGTRHVLGLLLMSLGLRETVKLLHPVRWVRGLFRPE